jgi:hypothetical protein
VSAPVLLLQVRVALALSERVAMGRRLLLQVVRGQAVVWIVGVAPDLVLDRQFPLDKESPETRWAFCRVLSLPYLPLLSESLTKWFR